LAFAARQYECVLSPAESQLALKDDSRKPWGISPGRLFSLYEIASWLAMEPFKAETFYKIGRLLEQLAAGHGSATDVGSQFYKRAIPNEALDDPLPENDKLSIQFNLMAIGKECERINLCRATQYGKDILRQFDMRRDWTYREIVSLLRELDKHIRWDMEKELFMYIPAERAQYYHNQALLSSQAMDNFPDAGEEIMLSGDCYAAGCWTASVTHSMRALEKPIHAVADAIGGVNLPKTIELSQWGEIHREIDNKVTKLRGAPLTSQRDEEIAFYSTLNLEFGYFNGIWRRFVAHSRKTYDSPQSKSAMAHVIAFVDTAAKKGLKQLP
jgi:hypothetical protein